MMKLPKLVLGLLVLAIVVCVGAAVAPAILRAADMKVPTAALRDVGSLAFLCGFFLGLGFFFARDLENAFLRWFGQPARATVLATRYTGERDNGHSVERIKLNVQPPEGATFIAVAEDVMATLPIAAASPGATVAVKYDPFTKEVAIERRPKAAKTKQENF
jgi:hypothetical protein